MIFLYLLGKSIDYFFQGLYMGSCGLILGTEAFYGQITNIPHSLCQSLYFRFCMLCEGKSLIVNFFCRKNNFHCMVGNALKIADAMQDNGHALAILQ